MRKLYLLATLFCLGIGGGAMAGENGESVVYGPTDFVFSYRGGYTGAFEGAEVTDGKEYAVFTVTPAPDDGGQATTPIRFEGSRVYGLYDGEKGGVAGGREILLYDYTPGVGEAWPGHVFNRDEDGVYTVVQTREATLFGAPRRVQRVAAGDRAQEWLSSPYHNATCWFYAGIMGEELVNVECVGNVTLGGFYPNPTATVLPTEYVAPYTPSPLLEVSSRDGKYRYTHTGLGVSPGNQIMREGNTWEYYSETPEFEAVHEMAFSGMVGRDGKLYGQFHTVRALVLDKATGILTELVNDDAASRCVLMRENLGEVYVRGVDDAEETLMYDFMLQEGDVFRAGADGEELTVVEMPVTEKDFHPGSSMSHSEPLKTYSFEGMTERMGVTEYTGVWGMNAGTLVNPMFAGGDFGGVAWPWAPAPDCTLASQWEMQRQPGEEVRVDLYTNPEVSGKVAALRALAGVGMTEADVAAVRWYTLQGMPVSAPERGQVLIRVASGRPQKVRY